MIQSKDGIIFLGPIPISASIKMKNFKEKPVAHPNSGLSGAWKTSMGSIPTGLSPDDFDRWLWARVEEAIRFQNSRDLRSSH